ncbi:MAG: heme ABC transporter permease [Alphaproteobacteria bacterium]|nr:heme ABC transporter permease [Alphaproteobacteria bacterium]
MPSTAALHRLANPARLARLSGAILPWTAGATVVLLGVGLYLSLLVAPADYQQGESVRIMFVHVPAAWMALMVYALLAAASASALIWKHPLADLTGKAAAPIGAAFTLIALATGSLWGQPMWGTWWVWDARLTSVLILFFLYLGYMSLWQAIEDPQKAGRAAAMLALVGVVNLPIIKFSVDWWNTLHQPASILRADGPTIHSAFLGPLLLMALGYLAFFVTVLIIRMRRELAARRLRAWRALQATE